MSPLHLTPSTAGILLAAGQSHRMMAAIGQPKQTMLLAGEPLCKYAALSMVKAGYSQLIAVIPAGPLGQEIQATLSLWPFEFVEHTRAQRGLLSSFQAALPAIKPNIQAATFALADMPFVLPETHHQLQRCFAKTKAPAILTCYGAQQTSAPPVLFTESGFSQINQLPVTDEGPKPLLKKWGHQVRRIQRPTEELIDIDTPQDLQKAWQVLQTQPHLHFAVRL